MLICAAAIAMSHAPVKVEIVAAGGKYELMRNGKPYYVKGAGGDTSEANLRRLVAAGGNSIRLWGTGPDTEAILDRAQRLGLTVTVGYWLGHADQGFRWSDQAAVDRQFAQVEDAVRKYRNHPAVLAWALGNEMEMGNDNPRLWQEIERMARMVKREDPNHPVMSVVAEISADKIKHVDTYAPSLDMLGINSYGGLATLPKRLKDFGFARPFLVTEFGPLGQWEVGKTAWGAAQEMTSTEKAALYKRNYQEQILANRGWCLGSYVFIWGNKQEETATWFGMLLPGGETLQSAEEMSNLWQGRYGANRVPQIATVRLDGPSEVTPGTVMLATVTASDPNNDKLTYEWTVSEEVRQRGSGGSFEATPADVKNAIQRNGQPTVSFTAPHPGAYRLFLVIRDGKGGAATANIPFLVKKSG